MTLFGDGVNVFLTPQAIYEQLTQGNGIRRLQSFQTIVAKEQSFESERADQIHSLAAVIKSGWEGSASLNAFGAALPLYECAMENSGHLDQAQDLLSRQIDSFITASNNVRPAPPPPENPIDERVPFDVDYEDVVTSYQSDAQHNIAIYREYDGASSYNETNMPQEFVASGRGGGDVAVEGPRDSIPVGEPEPRPGSGGYPGGGGPGYPGSGGYPGGGPGGSGPSGSSVDGPAVGGGPVGGVPVGGPGVTTPNEWRPSSEGSPLPVGYQPPVGGGASPGGGAVGGVPVGGLPGGYSGGGRGGVSGGPGGGAAGGSGSGAGSGGRVLGVGGGSGAGALATEAAAAQRAGQAAAARGGIGPVGGPVGGGRGKNDDDVEHERRYLVETDAEGTFGSDVLTAPQVIGDEEYED